MSRYIPQQRFETDFQGDMVSMLLKPLRYGHLMRVLPALEAGDGGGSFVSQLQEILPEYVSDFSGLKDADGNALPFSLVLEQSFFAELMMAIGTKVIELSSPKNPPKPGE